MSLVASGYSNSVNDKLIGKQEVIYVCAQTMGWAYIQYIKRRFIHCKVCKSGFFTEKVY
jgi:hypothetical protein